MKQLKLAFKQIDLSSYFIFFLVTFLPIFYTLVIRGVFYDETIHFNELALAENAPWLLLLFIVGIEVMYFPLISIFGHFIRKKQYRRVENGLKISLLLGVGVSIILLIVAFIFIPYCAPNSEVRHYLICEAISFCLFILVQIPLVFFQVKERRHLIEFVFLQLLFLVLFDLVIGHTNMLPVSLLPLGPALAYFVFLILELLVLAHKYQINIFSRNKINWHFLHHFFHLANHALIDAVIVDMILILFIENFGFNLGFAEFNSFHQTVLLLPITAMTVLVRSELALERRIDTVRIKVHRYALVSGLVSLVWSGVFLLVYLALGHELWDYLNMVEIENFSLYFLLMFFTINLRAVASVYRAAFHALGELHSLTNVAIRVALIVFLPFYIMANEIGFNYNPFQIALITGIGITLESALIILYFYLMLRRKRQGMPEFRQMH